jgi:hypothetical protein
MYNGAMEKRAALRLANYLRSLGHRTKIRQHKSCIGVSVYSVEWANDTRRNPIRRRKR